MKEMEKNISNSQNTESICRGIELLYRRSAMLNLYFSRIQAAEMEKQRLEKELKNIQDIIHEIEQKLATA